MASRLAVIDIGTVTTRLLIAQVDGTHIDTLVRKSTITQLGEGLGDSGRLTQDAMDRVAAAIEGYLALIEQHDARLAVCVATSAARDASNSDEFTARLAALGVTPTIIPGKREAALTFSGIVSAFPGRQLLTCDVGGGSTELVFGDADPDPVIYLSRSFDIGARRMTDAYLRSDPPTVSERASLRDDVTHDLKVGFFDSLETRPQRLIAVAGTATSAIAIAQRMEVYDSTRVHGAFLDTLALTDLIEELAALPLSQREKVVGLEPRRAGVIVAGMEVLSCILKLTGLDGMTVSESDILIGLVLDCIR